MDRWVGALLAACLLATPLAGQGGSAQRLGPAPIAAAHPPTTSARIPSLVASSDSHWVLGGIIGATFGLLVGYSIYSWPCETGNCDRQLTTYIIPVFAFGVLGALIGDAFKKH